MLERKSKIPVICSRAVTVLQGLWAAAWPGRKSLSTAVGKKEFQASAATRSTVGSPRPTHSNRYPTGIRSFVTRVRKYQYHTTADRKV